jgi:hypothetical protein
LSELVEWLLFGGDVYIVFDYFKININIITKTGYDLLRPVFNWSFDFHNCEGPKTGPRSWSFAVLGILQSQSGQVWSGPSFFAVSGLD